MKVIYAGYHNPHFTNTNVYLEKAIKGAGHDLVFFEDRNFIIPGRIRQRIPFLQRWDLKRLNRKLVELVRAEEPELCMVIGGHRILSETLLEMKRMGVTVVLWTTDIPIDYANILKTAPFYEYIFCAGSESIEILKARGLGNVFWMPFACDPDYHRPVELDGGERQKYARDVAFVGSFYPNRARMLEPISDLNIGVWGPYWRKVSKDSPLVRKVVDARLNYEEWIRIYSAAEIVLVIHYNDGRTPCNQASPKLYEALACRKFVLVDNQKDARALFKDREHVVFFNDEKDLRKKIIYYLSHPDERERIALKGYEEVLEKHTYKHRIEEMLAVIKTRKKRT